MATEILTLIIGRQFLNMIPSIIWLIFARFITFGISIVASYSNTVILLTSISFKSFYYTGVTGQNIPPPKYTHFISMGRLGWKYILAYHTGIQSIQSSKQNTGNYKTVVVKLTASPSNSYIYKIILYEQILITVDSEP